MVATDADVALRKIDVTNPCAAEEHNIEALRHVKVYNRGGNLVGTVVGLDVEGQESRRAGEEWQLIGRFSRHPRVYANHSSTSTTILNCLEKFVSIRGYRFLITYFRFGEDG